MKRIKRLKISITISVLVRLQFTFLNLCNVSVNTNLLQKLLYILYQRWLNLQLYITNLVQQLLTVLHTCMTMNKHVQQL